MASTFLFRNARRITTTPKIQIHPTLTTAAATATAARHTQKRLFTQSLLSKPVQIYRSTSTDPYVNLSIEHHLLQRSHPDSTVLFLYTNRPCVVIGRNQNPWLEVNLHLLRQGLPSPPQDAQDTAAAKDARRTDPGDSRLAIDLVRRRSGGGTVFHDAGNINWAVVCPPPAFDRDRHAEMVARALRGRLGVRRGGGGVRVRVNARHDIVMDVDGDDHADTAAAAAGGSSTGGTFKVSGSAYKLTRTRSLHHGTCLLSSPNLAGVSALLRSPAEGFIKARGVESVRSRIRNVGVGRGEFVDAVVAEFASMYGDGAGKGVVVGEEEALGLEEVVKGVKELRVRRCQRFAILLGMCADDAVQSADWIFGQTPQFTFSTHPTEDDPRERPELPASLPHGVSKHGRLLSTYCLTTTQFQAHFSVRHGEIQSAALSGLEYHDFVDEASQDAALSQALVKTRLHHISDWRETLRSASPVPVDTDEVGEWLNHMFGIQDCPEEGGLVSQIAGGILADALTTPLLA